MPTSGDSGELRILHWNVHSWRDAAGAPNPGAVTDLISEAKPHVVSLVEVNEPLGAPETLADLADKCGYSWIFVPSIELGPDPAARGYGNALLTRLPVIAVQHVGMYSPERRYDGTEPTESRSVTLARVMFSGASIWMGATHFPATHHGSRQTAAGMLRRLLGQVAAPWIICGDFNASFATLFRDGGGTGGKRRGWLRFPFPNRRRDIGTSPDDGLRVHPDPPRPTFPARRPVAAIDYAVSSPDIVTTTQILRVSASDHLPLLIAARFP